MEKLLYFKLGMNISTMYDLVPVFDIQFHGLRRTCKEFIIIILVALRVNFQNLLPLLEIERSKHHYHVDFSN